MIAAGGLGALLLVAAQPAGATPPAAASASAATAHFAPPLDRPMTYRVTTRRLGRNGALLSFALVYDLEWQRAGRGYRLLATLQRIESDAKPEVTRAVTAVLQPLVGEEMTYLVAPDGSQIELVDSEQLWDRALARTAAAGDGSRPDEAKQMAALIAALPPAERDRVAAADIGALIASPTLASATPASDANMSITQNGTLKTIAKVEQTILPAGAGAGSGETARPIEIAMQWTVDTATGLVVREQRQSWIVAPDGDARTLVEERVRAILPDDR